MESGDKILNRYTNTSIFILGVLIILYILKFKKRSIRDPNCINWSKYNILSDVKKPKKSENKERIKQRTKEFSKGTGFVKEEHKFQPNAPEKDKDKDKENYLNYDEADNLQDMINFAASIKDNGQGNSIESLYSQVLKSRSSMNNKPYNTNDKIDYAINEVLRQPSLHEKAKFERVLDLYSQLLAMRNKNLSEVTYVGLVELCIKTGNLNHASYFLCQMDRLKMNIPRSLLDLFVEYSTNHKIFEQANKQFNDTADPNYNKFDDYVPKDEPDYACYFRRRNLKNKKDIRKIFSNLKLDAKPFYPKSVEDEQLEAIKQKLNEIDTDKIQDFVPKQYRIVRKEEY